MRRSAAPPLNFAAMWARNQAATSPLGAARPLGITAMSAFFVSGMLASGLAAVSLLTPGGYLEPLWRLNPTGHAGLTELGAWGPLILTAVCLACAAAAYGFITRKRWGYRLGVVLLLANLIGDLVNAVFDRRALIGMPVVVLLLWYLSSPAVRRYFRFAEPFTA